MDDRDIRDDPNVIFLGDIARESVATAYQRMNRRKRERARERKAAPTRIEITERKPGGPDKRRDG